MIGVQAFTTIFTSGRRPIERERGKGFFLHGSKKEIDIFDLWGVGWEFGWEIGLEREFHNIKMIELYGVLKELA